MCLPKVVCVLLVYCCFFLCCLFFLYMHKQQLNHFSFTLQQWYRTFGLEKDLKKIRPKHLFVRVVGIICFSHLCVCHCKNSPKTCNLHYILVVARTCFFSFWATFSTHVQKVFSLSGFSKERIVWPSRCRRLWHRNYMLNSCSLYVRLWNGSCSVSLFSFIVGWHMSEVLFLGGHI